MSEWETVPDDRFRSSSYSGGGECVEVAHLGHVVYVRHSRHRGQKLLMFSASAWSAFLRALREDQLVLR